MKIVDVNISGRRYRLKDPVASAQIGEKKDAKTSHCWHLPVYQGKHYHILNVFVGGDGDIVEATINSDRISSSFLERLIDLNKISIG